MGWAFSSKRFRFTGTGKRDSKILLQSLQHRLSLVNRCHSLLLKTTVILAVEQSLPDAGVGGGIISRPVVAGLQLLSDRRNFRSQRAYVWQSVLDLLFVSDTVLRPRGLALDTRPVSIELLHR